MFAAVDVLGGLLLIVNPGFAHIWLFYFGAIVLLKGLESVISSAASKFYFDFIGWIDAIAGSILLITFFGSPVPFEMVVGIIILLKGLWSILFVF